MIQLLFTLVFAEMALVLALSFETPLRNLVIMGLDRVKRGRGHLMAHTVAGTLFVIFLSSLYSILEVEKPMADAGKINPTDQVLLANQLLEASLIGFSLFLQLMIERLHFHIKDLQQVGKRLEQQQSEFKTKLKGANPEIDNSALKGENKKA